jgi:tRNA (uracil-5-)-methyltransferase TRM9
MDSKTRDQLNRINRAFYAAVAEDFSATRERPWPGWKRVLENAKRCHEPGRAGELLRVLDVGCGNGRFASFLAAECDLEFRYLGIDSNRALLAIARRRCRNAPHIEFAYGDALSDLGRTTRSAEVGATASEVPGLGEAGFNLVALFGLLHHVPSFETRRGLLSRLADQLAPGALLALAAWRFGDLERFESRVSSWQEYNRQAAEPVDTAQLEPGDFLLGWGGQDAVPRYCHFVDEAEMEALLAPLELERIDEFSADGGSGDLNSNRYFNQYVVLGRSHGQG